MSYQFSKFQKLIDADPSLVPVSSSIDKVVASLPPVAGRPAKPRRSPQWNPLPTLDELLATAGLQGRGWRGWLRVAQVGRVLGLLTLYLSR